MDHLLSIDIGNTATSSALFRWPDSRPSPTPLLTETLSTLEILRPGRYRSLVRKLLRQRKINSKQITGVIVSSVVPEVDIHLRKELRSLFSFSPRFVSARNTTQVKIRYRRPAEVGADRLVNARASLALAKGPRIIIDFGTATTFDCVTSHGDYLGGVIAPGPVISAEALYRRTSKLPLVILEKPATILGRNTLESIQAGLYHGYRGLVKEIIFQLKKRMGSSSTVLTTGGQAHWILKGLDLVDHHVPHLTHLGLYLFWHDYYTKRRQPIPHKGAS